jgi:hypothetical protein
MVLALQRTWTLAMAPTRSIDWKKAEIGEIKDPTIGTFARAAIFANLLVVTIVVIVFSFFALKENAPRALQLLLWLIPFVTAVVWSSATAIYLMFLVAKLFRVFARRLVWSSGKPVVWDDWLDNP